MTELMLEMSAYLGVAALLGLFLGYLFWGWGQDGRISAARAEGAAGARTSVDGDTALKTQLANCAEERGRLEDQVEELKAKLRARSGRGADPAPALFERRAQEEEAPAETGAQAEPGDMEAAAAVEVAPAETVAAPLPVQPESAPAPRSLLSERPDSVDDLKRIKGVGVVMERVLNDKGIYLFRQVANFSAQDVAWVNEAIEAFPGRIERDRWVEQAQALYRETYGRPHDAPND